MGRARLSLIAGLIAASSAPAFGMRPADDGGGGAAPLARAAAPAPNPVYSPSRASKDPYVLADRGLYVLYTTDIGRLHSAVSKDLLRWADDRALEVEGEDEPFVWAASVLSEGGRYYLYYTAGGRTPDGGIDWPTFRIRVAVASSARGPFRLVGDLIEPPRPFAGKDYAGLIDPEIVRDYDGSLYCFYVAVLHGEGRHWEGIRVRRLRTPVEADPETPDTRVIDPRAGWERDIVEAPTVVRAGDRWALLYSGGPCSDGQAIGVAYSDRLMGSGGGQDRTWSKGSAPIWSPSPADDGWSQASLGSTCVARDPAGAPRLVYQGLDVPESEPSHSWTIGVDDLVVGNGRIAVTRRTRDPRRLRGPF